jgi:hypothetical protein
VRPHHEERDLPEVVEEERPCADEEAEPEVVESLESGSSPLPANHTGGRPGRAEDSQVRERSTRVLPLREESTAPCWSWSPGTLRPARLG